MTKPCDVCAKEKPLVQELHPLSGLFLGMVCRQCQGVLEAFEYDPEHQGEAS